MYSRKDMDRAWREGYVARDAGVTVVANPYRAGCSCADGPTYSGNGLICVRCEQWLRPEQQRREPTGLNWFWVKIENALISRRGPYANRSEAALVAELYGGTVVTGTHTAPHRGAT